MNRTKYKEEDFMYKKMGKLYVCGPMEYLVDKTGGKEHRAVWVQCDCGNKELRRVRSLMVSPEPMCHECFLKESGKRIGEGRHNGTIYSRGFTSHGQSKTRLYRIWSNMRSRCKYKSCDNYMWYGGRGIRVCDEWEHSFENFRDWAYTNGYDDTKEIDRIDSNGNYCPENCRWATRIEQTNNVSSNVNLTYGGLTYTLTQWSRMMGNEITEGLMHSRHRSGWSAEDILTIPSMKDCKSPESYKEKHGIKPFIFIDQSKLNTK